MKYSLIDKKKGEAHGFLKETHILSDKGEKMVVNENELRLIDTDISNAAKLLGGVLMSKSEIINELKKYKL